MKTSISDKFQTLREKLDFIFKVNEIELILTTFEDRTVKLSAREKAHVKTLQKSINKSIDKVLKGY